MSAIITNKLRIFNAQQFIESVNEQAVVWDSTVSYAEGEVVLSGTNLYIAMNSISENLPAPTHTTDALVNNWKFYSQSLFNNVYLTIGKSTAWDDDSNPPTPSDSVQYNYNTKLDITALKKIGPDSVTNAIPRINWESGKLYTMYEHDSEEEIIPNNYVLTESNNQYNVYKCINNTKYVNSTVGVQAINSTVKPTGTGTSLIKTGDGYVWKYMYSINLAGALKFLTKDYIPVKHVLSEPSDPSSPEYLQWAVKTYAENNRGAINYIKIIDDGGVGGNVGHAGGFGYNPSFTESGINIPEGSTSINFALSNTSNQTLASNNNYTGYYLFIRKSQSTTFNRRKISNWSYNNATNSVTLSLESSFATGEGGSGQIYIAPGIVVSGNSLSEESCEAYATVNANGEITEVVVTKAGSNYTTATAIVDVNGTTECKLKAIVSPTYGHGHNPVEELGGYYVMMATKLEYDEESTVDGVTKSVFPTTGAESSFRQITILCDPIDLGTNKVASLSVYRGPNHPDYEDGDDGFNVQTASGKVLYIENRQPVSRAADQIEDIKVVFEF